MAVHGSLTITPEWAKNVIGVEGRGVWSAEEARAHFACLCTLVADLRDRAGLARVLVDLREMEPQPKEVVEIIRDITAQIYKQQDRIAILVTTGMQRMQMSCLTETLNAQLFDDPFAALRWLNQH
ncbi:MAG TPA: hypothetical protein VF463_06315 [Sphingobium sp.]